MSLPAPSAGTAEGAAAPAAGQAARAVSATNWIVLVNWNGGEDTLECLESLLRLDDGDFAVVVVDNGSSDGSQDRIAEWAAHGDGARPQGGVWDRLPQERRWNADFARIAHGDLPRPTARITLIEAGSNLGFAAANNIGMRFAAGDPVARYFWILNNDTVAAPDSLSILHRRMEADPSIGMLGARLMFYHDPDRVQGLAGAFPRWKARSFHIGLGLTPDTLPPAEQVEAQMAYVLGASMFVRRDLVDRIGGMSEAYFLYFEEVDWAERLPAGSRLAIAQDAAVWHKEGGSIGSATETRPSDTSLYYINAGLLRYYWRHHRLRLPIALGRVLRESAGYRLRGDRAGARAVLQGLRDVLSGVRRRGRYGSAEFMAAARTE